MLVNISGSRCISCTKFTQYYAFNYKNEIERINCGYCGQRSRNVRPGDRCKQYREENNVYLGGVKNENRIWSDGIHHPAYRP